MLRGRRGRGNYQRGGFRGGNRDSIRGRRGRGSGRGQITPYIPVEEEEDLQKSFGRQIDYAGLLGKKRENLKEEEKEEEVESKILSELATLTMAARVEFESGPNGGKKEVSWSTQRKEPHVSFTLTAKNFAVVQLEVNGITTNPKAFKSAPGEESTGYPSEHAERYALADAINQAIEAGWEPEYKGKTLKPLNIPPEYEELAKFKEALQDVSLVLLTEKSLCTTQERLPKGEINCSEGLSKILSGENHKIYYAAIFGNKQDEQKIRAAREQYYKNTDYSAKKKFLAKNVTAVQEVTQNKTKKITIDAKENLEGSENSRKLSNKKKGERDELKEEKLIQITPEKTSKKSKSKKQKLSDVETGFQKRLSDVKEFSKPLNKGKRRTVQKVSQPKNAPTESLPKSKKKKRKLNTSQKDVIQEELKQSQEETPKISSSKNIKALKKPVEKFEVPVQQGKPMLTGYQRFQKKQSDFKKFRRKTPTLSSEKYKTPKFKPDGSGSE